MKPANIKFSISGAGILNHHSSKWMRTTDISIEFDILSMVIPLMANNIPLIHHILSVTIIQVGTEAG